MNRNDDSTVVDDDVEEETFGADELDSDADGDLDPDAQLGQWLHQLQALSEGLSGMQSSSAVGSLSINGRARPQLDSFRYSEANLEDSAEVDLDALIGELCALESQLNASEPPQPATMHCRPSGRPKDREEARTSGDLSQLTRAPAKTRCQSPDTDSAYCETISVLSESTQSSSHRSGGSSIDSTRGSMTTPSPTQLMEVVQAKIRTVKEEMQRENLDEAEVRLRLKNEKIKIALEKMKEASVKKLYVKVFTDDGSSKNILIDERWTVSYVLRQLAEKCQVPLTHNHAIVEYYPDLFMERVYEDHELIVENILMWTENSPNRLLFTEQPAKYDVFVRPEAYLLDHTHSDRNSLFSPEARQQLVEEFFAPSRVQPPELVGPLFLKQDGKKSWKKHTFVLRGSGLYYVPKGRGKSSRDLVCLSGFATVQAYKALDWKKKYKAPTPWGFAIKHPQIQVKASKYIKYLCAEDEATCQRWLTGIRIAKNGHQLLTNWQRFGAEEDAQTSKQLSAKSSLDGLNVVPIGKQWTRSTCSSVSSGAAQTNNAGSMDTLLNCTTTDGRGRVKSAASLVEPSKRISRMAIAVDTPTVFDGQCCNSPAQTAKACSISDARSVCSSSDFSDRVEQVSLNAFELDNCTGTVRRQGSKGSAGAKIPLTDATRQLAFPRTSANQSPAKRMSEAEEQASNDAAFCYDTCAEEENDSDEELPPPPPPLINTVCDIPSTSVFKEEFPPPPSSSVCFAASDEHASAAVKELPESRGVVPEPTMIRKSTLSNCSVKCGKMPPPPPPKRSETTRLSCGSVTGRCPPTSGQARQMPPKVPPKQGAHQTVNGESAMDTFHAELQRAMQKRLQKLETAEGQ